MQNSYQDIEEKELKLLRSFYQSNASQESRAALERFYKALRGPGGKARVLTAKEAVDDMREIILRNWKK